MSLRAEGRFFETLNYVYLLLFRVFSLSYSDEAEGTDLLMSILFLYWLVVRVIGIKVQTNASGMDAG